VTPLDLEICLWYHSRCEDMPWVLGDAPIRDEVVGRLMRLGLLRLSTPEEKKEDRHRGNPVMKYKYTAKLNAFVSMLCDTDMPKLVWMDPRTQRMITHAE